MMFLIALVMLATTVLTGGDEAGEANLSLAARLERLEETVRGLVSQPYCYTCGYQSAWIQPDSVIQYEILMSLTPALVCHKDTDQGNCNARYSILI